MAGNSLLPGASLYSLVLRIFLFNSLCKWSFSFLFGDWLISCGMVSWRLHHFADCRATDLFLSLNSIEWQLEHVRAGIRTYVFKISGSVFLWLPSTTSLYKCLAVTSQSSFWIYFILDVCLWKARSEKASEIGQAQIKLECKYLILLFF